MAHLTEDFSLAIFINLAQGIDQQNIQNGKEPIFADLLSDDQATADAYAERLRTIDLSAYSTPAKFVVYSGPPGGGKGAVWEAFERKYSDLIEKFVLIHTRNIRKGEQMGVNYHYRNPDHWFFVEEEWQGHVITALINNQLQGMAVKDIVDEFVYIDPVTKEEHKDTVYIEGLDTKLAQGSKLIILECGLAWFEALREKYGDDLMSIFISPFDEETLGALQSETKQDGGTKSCGQFLRDFAYSNLALFRTLFRPLRRLADRLGALVTTKFSVRRIRFVRELKELLDTAKFNAAVQSLEALERLEQEVAGIYNDRSQWESNSADRWKASLDRQSTGRTINVAFDALGKDLEKLGATADTLDYTKELVVRSAFINNEDLLYMSLQQQVTVIPYEFIVNRLVKGQDGDSQRQYPSFNPESSRARGFSMTEAENPKGSRQGIHKHPKIAERTLSGSDYTGYMDYGKLIKDLLEKYNVAGNKNIFNALGMDMLYDLEKQRTTSGVEKNEALLDDYIKTKGITLTAEEKRVVWDMWKNEDINELEKVYTSQVPFGYVVRTPAEYIHTIRNINKEIASIDWTFKDLYLQVFKVQGGGEAQGAPQILPPEIENGDGWELYTHILDHMIATIKTDKDGLPLFAKDEDGIHNPVADKIIDVVFKMIAVKPGKETKVFDFAQLYPGLQIVRIMPWPKNIGGDWNMAAERSKLKALLTVIKARGPPEVIPDILGGSQIVLNNNDQVNTITGFKIKNTSDDDYELIIVTASESILADPKDGGSNAQALKSSVYSILGMIRLALRKVGLIAYGAVVVIWLRVKNLRAGINTVTLLQAREPTVAGIFGSAGIFTAMAYSADGGEEAKQDIIIFRRLHAREWVLNNQGISDELARAMLEAADPLAVDEATFVAMVLRALGVDDFAGLESRQILESEAPAVSRIIERLREAEMRGTISAFAFSRELAKHIINSLKLDFEIIGYAGVTGEQYLDVRDAEGNAIGLVMPKTQMHLAGEWHSDVYVFVINKDGQILLQRRAASKKMYPGLLEASASGHVLAGETPEQAAVSRMQQELGMKVQADHLIRITSQRGIRIQRDFIQQGMIENTFTHVFAYVIPEAAQVTLHTDEIFGVEFVKLNSLLKSIAHSKRKYAGIKDVLANPDVVALLRFIAGQIQEHIRDNEGAVFAEDITYRIRNLLDPNGVKNVVIVTPESEPFFKTGGLGDVCGELATALSNFGLNVSVILYKYDAVDESMLVNTGITCMVDIEYKQLPCRIWKGTNGNVNYYFLEEAGWFSEVREGSTTYYTSAGSAWFRQPYSGDKLNFAVGLSEGALKAVKALVEAGEMPQPQVLHANDWPAALVPVFVKTKYRNDPIISQAATLFSVHNPKHTAGWIPGNRFPELGINGEHWFGMRQPESEHHFCLMRGAITHADKLNAVSRTNRDEMMTPSGGSGLHEAYRARIGDLLGIPNGIYYPIWQPVSKQEKPLKKAAMQAKLRFKVDQHIPLIGMVARIDEQKGVRQVVRAIDRLLLETNGGVQFMYLGKGDTSSQYATEVADELQALQARWPKNVNFKQKYTTDEQRDVFHALDIFLYPSEFEPFGTRPVVALINRVPGVVRRTGGLADNFQEYEWFTGKGNGWLFENINDEELYAAIWRAINTFRVPEHWERVTENAAGHDWSWRGPVKEYINIYRWAREHAGLSLDGGVIADAFLKITRFAEGMRGFNDLLMLFGAVVVITLEVKKIYVRNTDLVMGLPAKDLTTQYLAQMQAVHADGGELPHYLDELKSFLDIQEYDDVLAAIRQLEALEQQIREDTQKHPALWRINDRDLWQKALRLGKQGFALSKTFGLLAETIAMRNGSTFLREYTRALYIRAAIVDNADTIYMTQDKQVSVIPSAFVVSRWVQDSKRQYTAFSQTSSRALGLSLSEGENRIASRQGIHTHEAEELTFSGAENIAFVDYNGLIHELSIKYGFAPDSGLAKVLLRDALYAASISPDELQKCCQGIYLGVEEHALLARIISETDINALEAKYSQQMPFGCLVRIPAGYSHTLRNTDAIAPSIDWTFKDIFARLFKSSGETIVSGRYALVPAQVTQGNGWAVYSHILPAMAAQLKTDEEGNVIFKQDAAGVYNPEVSLVMDIDFKIITIKPGETTDVIPFASLYPGLQVVRFMPWPKNISADWNAETDSAKLSATMGILRMRGPPEQITLSSASHVVLNNNVGENPITGFTLANRSERDYEIIVITASEHIGVRAFARLLDQIDLSQYHLNRIPAGSSADGYAAVLKAVTNFDRPYVQAFLRYA
ncbi:MAG TPA: glycogen/starch synthase, partial [Candidatus Omnitrophota bacterium]|nr:glycogen/starch synthase [Candidatus Omnitrophota bacterium]